MNGLCHKCRKKLSKDDLKRINRRDKEDPSMGLCSACAEDVSDYKRTARKKALKEGICPICSKRKILPGYTTCIKCLSASHRQRYIEGLCGRCGDKPLAKNSISLCSACLKETRELAREYRKKQK
jgi:uncharacterized CHY-type Zn-finger protein